MNYIKRVPGDVVGKGNTKSDILTLLGLNVTPLDNKNDGRGGDVISSVVIGDKQYALSDVLTALASAMGGGGGSGIFWVNGEFQEDDSLTLDKTYSEIKSAFNGGQMVALKTTYYNEEPPSFMLFYLVGCGENINFTRMPTIINDAVYGTNITIYDDDSVIVVETSMTLGPQ